MPKLKPIFKPWFSSSSIVGVMPQIGVKMESRGHFAHSRFLSLCSTVCARILPGTVKAPTWVQPCGRRSQCQKHYTGSWLRTGAGPQRRGVTFRLAPRNSREFAVAAVVITLHRRNIRISPAGLCTCREERHHGPAGCHGDGDIQSRGASYWGLI